MPFLVGMQHKTAEVSAMVGGLVRVNVTKDRVKVCPLHAVHRTQITMGSFWARGRNIKMCTVSTYVCTSARQRLVSRLYALICGCLQRSSLYFTLARACSCSSAQVASWTPCARL